MLFFNPWLLVGLGGVLIPILLHLIRKQAAKPYDWGAMRFLFDTVVARRKSMEWEDVLLMAARCLLMALVALTIARPFVPPDSQIPWMFVMPMVLIGVSFLGASFVMSSRRWRWIVRGGSVVLIAGAVSLVWLEKSLNLKRFQTSARRDVALVIDASTSMMVENGGTSSFNSLVEEAKIFVKDAPRGTAFTVVLGGPVPELKTETPLTRRTDVLEVLDSLEPMGGGFQAHDALGMATLSLSEGRGGMADIVVFSDGQRLGWKLDQPSAWGQLGEIWEGIDAKPRLLMRTVAPPAKLRNVAVDQVFLSREVVGVDRPVTVKIRVENTGTEVVTPGELVMIVGERKEERKGLGQMLPGESAEVDFEVSFSEAGPQVIRVRIDGEDDLAEDDNGELVVNVKKVLPVLLVEGNAEAGFFERATGYLGLALAPTGEGSGEQWLMETRVVDTTALAGEDFSKEEVIVLGDVRRLPPKVTEKIARFVIRGGGLLVLAGEKLEPEFYRNWEEGSVEVLPLELGEMLMPEQQVALSPSSFSHPALKVFQGRAGDGFRRLGVRGYRKGVELRPGAVVAGRYSDGEVFLAAHEYGMGRVMVSTCGWDMRLGNVPAQPVFVPLAHEVVSWLAGGGQPELNVKASWSPSILFPSAGGLRGRYYVRKGEEWKLVLDRVDQVVDFSWEGGSFAEGFPDDQFKVVWEGGIFFRVGGEYTFKIAADDNILMVLDGEEVAFAKYKHTATHRVNVEPGTLLPVRLEMEESWGWAHAWFEWKRPDGIVEDVPTSALVPMVGDGARVVLGQAKAVDSKGAQRKATAILGGRGRMLEVDGVALPGAYRVGVPETLKKELGSDELPLVVVRDLEESRFVGFNDDDRALISREIDLVEVGSVQDVLAVLRGEGFGKELWKVLVLSALGIFFLEGFLARWVSKSRRSGETVRVDFENRDEVSEEFLKVVEEVKG